MTDIDPLSSSPGTVVPSGSYVSPGGEQGPIGAAGAPGATGPQGNPGATGPAGNIGKHTIWVAAGAMISRATNGAAPGTIEMTTNKNIVRTLDFDTTTQEFAQFEIAMPKSWDVGTVTFVPIWSNAATTVNFGVVWALQGICRADGAGPIDQAFGTEQTSTDTGGFSNTIYIGPESAAITLSTATENSVVLFQIKRNPAAAADTLAIDARLHGIKLFYTTTVGTDN